MKRVMAVFGLVFLGVSILGTGVARGQVPGYIEVWGENGHDQCGVPGANADFVAVSGGRYHSLGLRSDGTILAWLFNWEGQCDVPAPNEDFTAVAAGFIHSLGLKSDGTIMAWGDNAQGQCDVPGTNGDFTAVAAGMHHSLGLKSDGTIVAWGWNTQGQCDVPEPNTGFIAVAGGKLHSLGLKPGGTIVAWGYAGHGQCDVPAPNEDFIAVAAGDNQSLGLKSDGTILAWGDNLDGQCDVPDPNTGFSAVAGGGSHSLGLKSDGTIVVWGRNDEFQCDVPAPNEDFIAIGGGSFHSLGVKGPDTPVETAFYATLVPEDNAVLLRWVLPGCPGVGLSIYRSLSADGPYSCLTPNPLDPTLGSYADETAWPGGTFWYELRAVLDSGEEIVATDIHPSVVVPGTLVFGIRYVMPNPATARTTIGYTLPNGWRSARLSVHDVTGRLVQQLDPATGAQGFVAVDWDGRASSGEQAASGVYFVRLEVDGAMATQRMVLLR